MLTLECLLSRAGVVVIQLGQQLWRETCAKCFDWGILNKAIDYCEVSMRQTTLFKPDRLDLLSTENHQRNIAIQCVPSNPAEETF